MNKLLVKLFIPDYQNVESPKVRERYGKLAGIVGILSNLILCILKILIGIFSASIAIIADGINNLSDASSSIITLVGFKLAAQPEDKDHPYGHARIEYLTGLLISILIIVIGLLLLKSSIEKILHPTGLTFTFTTILVLVLAILVKLWQNFFYRYMGKAIDSLTLKATATDSRNDVIATSVVLVGVLITKFTGIVLDGYLGCLVALFILWSGIQLIRETSSPLLGEAPDEELVRKIVTLVQKEEAVLGIHDLVVHNYGPGKIFASMHIEVDADGDLMESHDMIDNIEREVGRQLNIHFVVHMDPIKLNDPILIGVRETISKAIATLDCVTDLHDLRAVPGPTHTNIIFDLVLQSACTMDEREITAFLQDQLQQEYPNYFVVITFDKAYTQL
ncbi:MAG: cation diffusion facilitator family transporter [Anaerovoracaceae bacterium]